MANISGAAAASSKAETRRKAEEAAAQGEERRLAIWPLCRLRFFIGIIGGLSAVVYLA